MKKGDFQVKQLFSVIAIFLLCATAAFSAGEDLLPGSDISIKFYDRRVYYPGDSASEPIFVQITIANSSPETLRFKLADQRSFSVDFSAANTRNLLLEHSEPWLRKRNSNGQIYFREVSIEPGESYSFIENVKDYLKIDNPGLYILDCAFFPELKHQTGDGEPCVRSNKLTLEVKPSPGPAAVKVLPVSPVTAEVLQAEAIPPDQVINYILIARQRSHWEQFFLYLDLEEMITRDPARNRRYRAESESGRMQMIDNYKSELSQAKADKDISTIPNEFKIERTTYGDTEGTVTVMEWFDYRTFREKKRFTYYLAAKNGIWKVIDYKVDNLGTE
jgi:hypothetical protein